MQENRENTASTAGEFLRSFRDLTAERSKKGNPNRDQKHYCIFEVQWNGKNIILGKKPVLNRSEKSSRLFYFELTAVKIWQVGQNYDWNTTILTEIDTLQQTAATNSDRATGRAKTDFSCGKLIKLKSNQIHRTLRLFDKSCFIQLWNRRQALNVAVGSFG